LSAGSFVLLDGKWNIQLWPDNAKQGSGKVYRFKVTVLAELIGAELDAKVSSDA
jgi:hypothetical protein